MKVSCLKFVWPFGEFPNRNVKQTRTKNKISGHVIRSAAYAVSFAFAFIALSSAFNSPNRWQKSGWVIRARETTGGLPDGVSKVRFPFAFVFSFC